MNRYLVSLMMSGRVADYTASGGGLTPEGALVSVFDRCFPLSSRAPDGVSAAVETLPT